MLKNILFLILCYLCAFCTVQNVISRIHRLSWKLFPLFFIVNVDVLVFFFFFGMDKFQNQRFENLIKGKSKDVILRNVYFFSIIKWYYFIIIITKTDYKFILHWILLYGKIVAFFFNKNLNSVTLFDSWNK